MTTTTKFSPDLTTATPAEIDGQLFPIWNRIDAAEHRAAQMRNSIDHTLGEIALAHDEGRSAAYNENYTLPGEFERLEEQEQLVRDAEAEAAPFESEWVARRWVRYVVVPGGHLHFSRCHTLTPGATRVGAVAEASGLDQDQVVGHFGETACTHCFPDAPVAAKKTPAEEGFCDRSGYQVPSDLLDKMNFWSRGRGRVRCSHCGEGVSLTSTGKMRKHKAAA